MLQVSYKRVGEPIKTVFGGEVYRAIKTVEGVSGLEPIEGCLVFESSGGFTPYFIPQECVDAIVKLEAGYDKRN